MASSNSILMHVLAWAHILNLWDLEMKFLDMLVSELPALGGLPHGAEWIHQSSWEGELYFYDESSNLMEGFRGIFMKEIAEDSQTEITKEQYLNALAASGTDK